MLIMMVRLCCELMAVSVCGLGTDLLCVHGEDIIVLGYKPLQCISAPPSI